MVATKNINDLDPTQAIGWATDLLTRLGVGSVGLNAALTVEQVALNAPAAYGVAHIYDTGVGSGSGITLSGAAVIIYGGSNALVSINSANGVRLASHMSLGWCADHSSSNVPDLPLYRDAAGILAQRNGSNPQAFNIYNTYTSGSVYERGFMRWVSNVLEIGTEHSGGTTRHIRLVIGSTTIFDAYANLFFVNGTVLSPDPGVFSLGQNDYPWKDIFLRPSSSLTPTNNGDLNIEATSDTTLTLKLKGSDSVVRSISLTLT